MTNGQKLLAIGGFGLLATAVVAGIRVSNFKKDAEQLKFNAVPARPSFDGTNIQLPATVFLENPTQTLFEFTKPGIKIMVGNHEIASFDPTEKGLIRLLQLDPMSKKDFPIVLTIPYEKFLAVSQSAVLGLLDGLEIPGKAHITTTFAIPVLPLLPSVNHKIEEVVEFVIKKPQK